MNWDDLKVVIAVGRTGSLTRAAEMLGINQSTATRRLVALEGALGTSLFIRSAAGLTPTDAGNSALARASEIEVRVDRLRDEVERDGAAPKGSVSLRGEPWVLERLAALALRTFVETYPGIDLVLDASASPEAPRRGATVSLWFEVEARDLEFAIKLGGVPHAVYGPAEGAGDLRTWIAGTSGARPLTMRALERLMAPGESIRAEATDERIILGAVANGIGKAFLPVCLADADPRLARLGEGKPEVVRMLSLHLHPDTVRTARVRAVVRWLRESFEPIFAAKGLAQPGDRS